MLLWHCRYRSNLLWRACLGSTDDSLHLGPPPAAERQLRLHDADPAGAPATLAPPPALLLLSVGAAPHPPPPLLLLPPPLPPLPLPLSLSLPDGFVRLEGPELAAPVELAGLLAGHEVGGVDAGARVVQAEVSAVGEALGGADDWRKKNCHV